MKIISVVFLVLAFSIVGLIISPAGYVYALGDAPDPDCALEGASCDPPGFELAEYWIVKALYAVWAFGGLVFMFGLIAIGFQWMTSGGEQQKLQELKKQATYWAISIPIFFLGVPTVSFIMNDVFEVNSTNNCYSNLIENGIPTFQLIFPEACDTCEGTRTQYNYVCIDGEWTNPR